MTDHSALMLHHEAAPLTMAGVLDRYDALHDGQTIDSGLERVGHIEPAVIGRALLNRLFENRWEYDVDAAQNPDLLNDSEIVSARSAFMAIVRKDIELADIVAQSDRTLVQASHTGAAHIPWHADLPGGPIVRWVTSLGEASTQGAKGQLTTEELEAAHKEGAIDANSLLEMQTFDPGDVLRFTNGDLHASPNGHAPRVLFQYTIALTPRTRNRSSLTTAY